MKPTTKKTVATAVLVSSISVATVVALYEGRAVVASTDGADLEPVRTVSAAESSPVLFDDADDDESRLDAPAAGDRETVLRNQLKMRRAEVQELESEIEGLEAELEQSGGPEVGTSEWVTACAMGKAEHVAGCSYFDPPQEVLDEMARCSVVKIDAPPLLYGGEPAVAMMKKDLGLQGEEEEAFDRATQTFLSDFEEQLQTLATDAGVDPELIDRLPSHALQQLIQSDLDKSEWPSVQKQIARERAGHVPAPDAEVRSLLDRYARSVTDVGTDFERYLAEELGPERARELRAARNGWGLPGWDNTRSVFSAPCSTDSE
jgi:hypothetical protein